MNTTKKLTKLLVLSLIIGLTACGGSDSVKDEQLSGFMLGGIYFMNGYGGIDAVNGMLSDYNSNTELVEGYKEIFEFPFDSSQKSGVINMFKNMWDINDKASLLATIEDLKTRDHQYKAWDYARIVNNTAMGYAAGYLTKDEVYKINAEVLPLAREKYKNWDDYFVDYNKGRIDWNKDDPDGASFESLAQNITKADKSIYKILPLNQ